MRRYEVAVSLNMFGLSGHLFIPSALLTGNSKIIANLNNYCSATSNQAVLLSLSVVLRSIKNIDQFGPWRDPVGPLIGKGPPISPSQGQF